MANPEHLAILKQGVEVWNQWRQEHTDIRPDLRHADLSFANLYRADLNGAYLDRANLRKAHLEGADLRRAYLSHAYLNGANLGEADLSEANLSEANLGYLSWSFFKNDGDEPDPFENGFGDNPTTNLTRANLTRANLTRTNLSEADLTKAKIGWTIFSGTDLRYVKGLKTIDHLGPSTIGIDTIYLSKDTIPEAFLKGAGVDDTFLTYIRSLVGKAIEFYSCFISYSSQDDAFAKQLYADLQSRGVRCWFAPYDLKVGDKWRDRIEESIRLHDKLLLVLSQHSIESPRVEEEAISAQEKEERYFRETGVERLVLFPIRLDEAVMNTSKAWAANLRRLRHIGDFHNWKQHDAYQKAFNRLLRDLKAEAQKIGSRDATTNDK